MPENRLTRWARLIKFLPPEEVPSFLEDVDRNPNGIGSRLRAWKAFRSLDAETRKQLWNEGVQAWNKAKQEKAAQVDSLVDGREPFRNS